MCRKNFDEAVRLQSKKKEKGIREVRGEILHGQWIVAAAHPAWPTHRPCYSPEEMHDREPIVT